MSGEVVYEAVDLRVFTEPQQGAYYDDLLAVAQTAEQSGFSGFFRSDHLLRMGNGPAQPGPTHAWLSLAGLARETSTIRLGTLVSPVTFYQPGLLAITVAQVDNMSGGRVEFGFGAGWYKAEHSANGLAFPALGERFDRFEEYLEQIHGLWSTPEGQLYNHSGSFHTFSNAPGLPKPAQRPFPPVIIGGRGAKRTPKLAARYASDYNVAFASSDQIKSANERVDAACEAIGRNPSEIVRSITALMCVGGSEAEVNRRAAAIGCDISEFRSTSVAGTTQEAIDKLGHYADIGIQRVYLQVLDLGDLDHISMVGSDVRPAVASL